MKLLTHSSSKPWKISKEHERTFSAKNMGEMLTAFNRVSQDIFYVIDYYRQKLITGSASTLTLTGHSKAVIEKEGFGYYNRILTEEEKEWLLRLNEETHRFFSDYPEDGRMDLLFSYDLIVETTTHREIILHHKLTPFELCKNGNLWLALCHVTIKPFLQTPYKATACNVEIGTRYDFVKGSYVRSDTKILTQEEIGIIKRASNDLTTADICKHFDFSESTLKQKKKVIREKLETKTFVGAVSKAYQLGVI